MRIFPFYLEYATYCLFPISKFTNRLHCIAHPLNNEILLRLDDNLTTHNKLLDAKQSSKFSTFCGNDVLSLAYFFQVQNPTMELVLSISPCVAKRQSVPFLTLSTVKLTVSFTTTKEYIPKKNFHILYWIKSRSPHLANP